MDKSGIDQDYDLRQHKLMLRMIEDYQNGSIELEQLITNLDALRNALETPSESWLSEFEPALGKLEDTYASMLDEDRTSLDSIDRRLIEEAVSSLASLARSEIANGGQADQ